MSVSREMAEGLLAKYAEILAMRVEHGSGREDAAQARVRMAELASRFPGALRELDDLDLAEIQGRIAGLEAVVRGDTQQGEPWMEATALFHRRMGGALVAKRWLDGRRDVDAAVQDDFRRSLDGLPSDAHAWAEELALIAAPPRGRVVDVVIARLARDLGTNEAEVRRLVFGAGRRASRLQ